MKKLVIGVGGMTNGGKSTLARSLQQKISNSCVIAQDTFFKDDAVVPVDDRGFKQYDVLDALHMDRMMSRVQSWRRDPVSFLKDQSIEVDSESDTFVLIVEGFLIFNHRPLNELFHARYFLEISYDECKLRRSSRVYTPPDLPGYFDGHVWPMFVRNRREMEEVVSGIGEVDSQRPSTSGEKEKFVSVSVFRRI